MKKSKLSTKWIITYVFLALAVAALIYLLAFKMPQMKQYKAAISARNTNKANAEFLANSTIESEDDAPYLETGIDGVYFTANYDGKIKFYKFANGQYESVKTSYTKTITLPTANKASAKISFITINDQTVGFGVYSSRNSENYPYAFIKVIPNKITENYDYIAFVDEDISDYYNNNKTYETAYVFSSKEGTLDEIFALEDDTSFIPVELIAARNDGFYYFSKNEDGTYTLSYKSTVFGKEYALSSTLALPYAFNKEGALLLLETAKVEGLADDTSFYLIESGAIDAMPIKEFKGEISSYLVKDSYIFNPTTKTLYDINSNAEQVINATNELTNVTDFDVTLGGARIAIAGSIDDKTDMLLLYEFATDNSKLIGGDNLFLVDNPNITVTDGYVTFLSPAQTSDNIVNVAIPWEKVF